MQNQDQNNNDNNFFNQNPLIAFAIFSVVIILLFKMLIGGEANNITTNPKSLTQRVSYS